jgi:murein DD-endopeptidase MepM/ murein hydrolase activator NlpD
MSPLESVLKLKKRYYILLVSREADGTLNKVPIPLHYVYSFAAAAVIGLFTITGLAGSYSRMLIKTARFNEVRQDRDSLRKDYARLEKAGQEREVQAASLGSLATEVSAIYGFTASRLSAPLHRRHGAKGVPDAATTADAALIGSSDDNYYKSLDTFVALRRSAFNGTLARPVIGGIATTGTLTGMTSLSGLDETINAPSLWPVVGSISSGFGQREDPVLGTGEGEFHKGVDIAAPLGTPIHAAADGVVLEAGMGNGYGREVLIDHGHGLRTLYGHMSGWNVVAGQTVVRGQVIGFVGHSGRTTGNHVHYEVQIRGTAVNPHKYLRETMNQMDTQLAKN